MIASLLFQLAIVWSDGDSGYIGGTQFRLANVDAPETWKYDCLVERELGYAAKSAAETLTQGAELSYDPLSTDHYGRIVITLYADGVDVGEEMIRAGHARPWPHDQKTNRATGPRPDWCDSP